jgi:TRAP-type C4-dicarboxylate transport system permease small subunit
VFIVYGYNFTVLMSKSTMAGTGLPQSILYGAIPVSGVLMLIYGIELLFKKGMHQEWDDQIEE